MSRHRTCFPLPVWIETPELLSCLGSYHSCTIMPFMLPTAPSVATFDLPEPFEGVDIALLCILSTITRSTPCTPEGALHAKHVGIKHRSNPPRPPLVENYNPNSLVLFHHEVPHYLKEGRYSIITVSVNRV